MIQIWSHKYSDAEYVAGVKAGNQRIQSRFFDYCREYFTNYHSKLFLAGHEKVDDIFENSFITLWQKIEKGDLYSDGECVKTKDGKRLSCNITTYLMSIAWNNYRAYTRKQQDVSLDDIFTSYDILSLNYTDNDDDDSIMFDIVSQCVSKMSTRCRQILTMFYYECMKLDDIMRELNTFSSKDALKTTKNKCYNTLKENVLLQYNKEMEK